MYNKNMGKKILVVDDTKTWLDFHTNLITEFYGDLFEVITAHSAKEALNIIMENAQSPFLMIISDLQMENDFEPQLAGEWLAEKIKSLSFCSQTQIVLISAMYNIEFIAAQLQVECIPKIRLVNNKLLLKFMFEKLMPFLNKIN